MKSLPLTLLALVLGACSQFPPGVQDRAEPKPQQREIPVEQYERMVSEFEAGPSLENEIRRICGVYEPRPDTRNKLEEAKWYKAFELCADRTETSYDRQARQRTLNALAATELRLANAAGLSGEGRITIPDIEQEAAAAKDFLARAQTRFQARQAAPDESVNAQDFDATLETIRATIERMDQGGSAAPSADSEAPRESTYYVARLLPDGANVALGDGGESCIANMPCEVGSVIPLIGVSRYCDEAGEVSATTSGWGLVVQRYAPGTRDEEKRIVSGDDRAHGHVVARADIDALSRGLDEVHALRNAQGSRILFASYERFYEENTRRRGCGDTWRDGAHARVANNPSWVTGYTPPTR